MAAGIRGAREAAQLLVGAAFRTQGSGKDWQVQASRHPGTTLVPGSLCRGSIWMPLSQHEVRLVAAKHFRAALAAS